VLAERKLVGGRKREEGKAPLHGPVIFSFPCGPDRPDDRRKGGENEEGKRSRVPDYSFLRVHLFRLFKSGKGEGEHQVRTDSIPRRERREKKREKEERSSHGVLLRHPGAVCTRGEEENLKKKRKKKKKGANRQVDSLSGTFWGDKKKS